MRRAPTFAAALAALLVATTSLVGMAVRRPAEARIQEAIIVEAGKPVEMTYDPLIGIDPSERDAVDLTPSGCDNVTVCDHIPVQVVVPGNLGPNDEPTLLVEVTWDDPSGENANDLDVFLYDNQQVSGSGYSKMTKAATSQNPEKLRLVHAVLGDYNLVVRNMSGVNTGYKLTARLTTERFESPVELLATPPKPEESRQEAAPPPPESLEPETTPTTLAPVAQERDESFDFGPSDFEDELAGPGLPDFGEPVNLPRSKGKVSKTNVILGLVVAPSLLAAGLVLFLIRQRRSRLGL